MIPNDIAGPTVCPTSTCEKYFQNSNSCVIDKPAIVVVFPTVLQFFSMCHYSYQYCYLFHHILLLEECL